MITTTDSRHLLRRALAGNAVFSLVSGTVVAVLASPLSDVADVPAWLLVVLGAGVVGFGLSLGVPLRMGTPLRRLGWIGFAADAAWVVGAAVVLLSPGTIAGAGKWLLAAITIAVGGFGIAEWLGLRRLDA